MHSYKPAIIAAVAMLAIAALAVGLGIYDPVPNALTAITAMAVVQSAYGDTMEPAVAGMWANMTNWDADTRICETAAGIGFGLACGQGSADKGVILGSTLANFVGVSVKDITVLNSTSPDKYPQYSNVALANEGDIWVQTSVATSPTDVVHYDATTGIFAISGGSGPIAGARWMKSRAAGLGLLRLSGHLPVP